MTTMPYPKYAFPCATQDLTRPLLSIILNCTRLSLESIILNQNLSSRLCGILPIMARTAYPGASNPFPICLFSLIRLKPLYLCLYAYNALPPTASILCFCLLIFVLCSCLILKAINLCFHIGP